jgi:hypothetical protein
MATTKITSPDLFDLGSLNTALKLPSGTTAQRPTSPSTGEWRYNTTTNLVEFWDGGEWRDLQSEDIPPTPSENFNIVLYTGNGSTQAITGVGFKPDLVWVKVRSTTGSGPLADSSRGTGKAMYSNLSDADYTFPAGQGVTSFDADGFSIGDDSTGNGGYNGNGKTYVAWCWKANGGTTTAGSGTNTTSVTNQANTKAGFSISTFTGSATAAGNFTHGLGEVPEMYIVKSVSFADSWFMYHKDLGSGSNAQEYALRLNTNAAQQNNSGFWNNTAPTSTLISLNSGILVNNATYVAYAFKSVAGFSSIGSYIGNASQNGPLVVTGFEPAFVLVKNINILSHWRIVDNKRSPLNHRQRALFPDLNVAESNDSNDAVDFLSTGFKISNDNSYWNANADKFIYIAFASDPTAAPTLAASFSNVAYFGDGQSNRAITGLGFSPSWVWIKNRVAARDHVEFDYVRLLGSELVPGNYTNLDAADFNATANDFNSFDTDGFTVGQDPYTNDAGSDMIAWTWKANPIPAINNDGDIQSIVSANQAAGFSIVTYTGNSTAGATVGHGLTVAPDAVIIKCMNTGSTNWINYYETIGVNDYLTLNLNNALDTFSNWFASNATTFTLNNTFGNANTTGRTYVAYCFKSTAGFSKMGSYTGTGSAGNAQNVGFTPSWVMIKRTNSISDWYMFDTARGDTRVLYPNGANAEGVNSGLTSFDSDGFTLGSATSANESGKTYIYMAFKENIATPALPAGEADFLVVAGGGGGGGGLYGRGGSGAGAGGLRTSIGSASGGGSSAESNITLASGTYTITIGTGGSSGSFGNTGGTGNNSSITGSVSITSDGGGYSASGTNGAGGAGGSGGSGYDGGGAATANQGYPGTRNLYNSTYYGGGGGGAAGTGGVAPAAGNGGPGLQVNGTYYAGGGGTGQNSGQGPGAGGTGGGGEGQDLNFYTTPCDGDANTGGGGGGGTYTSSGVPGTTRGGQGGSGVVILQMRTSDYSGVTTGSPSVSVVGGLVTLTYTGSGTYVHS